MKNAYMVLSVVVVLVLAVCAAHGGKIPINNPGFEDPPLVDDDYGWSMDNQGWGYVGNNGYLGPWNPTTADYPGEAPEGLNVGWTNPGEDPLDANLAVPGGFAQVLSAPLTAGTTYKLTVKVGSSLTYPGSGYAVQLLAGGIPQPTGDGSNYTGAVTGGTLLAQDNNSLAIANGTFVTSTVTYTYSPADSDLLEQPLQVRLIALGWEEVEYDSVSVEATLPADKALIAPTKGLYVKDGAVQDNYSLDIGHGNWTGDARALVKYDLSSLASATISRATLYLLQSDLGTFDQNGQAQLRRIGTSNWDGTESAAVLAGLVADAKSAAIANFSPGPNPQGGLYGVDVTDIIRAWADGSLPNYGFGLMQASEGLADSARQFGADPMLLIEYLLGDANGDGVVDAADYITLKKNFGKTTGAGASAGDFNSSGKVNWADLNILTNNFGAGAPAPAVTPEPCSAMLLVLGAVALMRRRAGIGRVGR